MSLTDQNTWMQIAAILHLDAVCVVSTRGFLFMMAWHWIQSPERLQGAGDVQLGFESFNVNNNVAHPKDSRCVNATAFSTLKTIYVALMRKTRALRTDFHDMLLSDGSVKVMKAYRQWQKQAATLPWKWQPCLHTSFKWANDSIVKIGCSYIEPEIEFNWIFESNFRDRW